MPTELFANTATTTLGAAMTDTTGTTLTVASSALFPAAVTAVSQFRVKVDTELLIVTNVSGTTWTVTRGAEGSTAATHLSAAPVTHVLTAGVMAGFSPIIGKVGASAPLTLTLTPTDIPGVTVTITTAAAGRLVATATLDITAGGDVAVGVLNVDGTAQAAGILSSTGRGTYSQSWAVSLSAGTHVIKMQAYNASTTGAVVNQTSTSLVYMFFPGA